ncbi:MAG: UDP-N-acetylmuramoyl-L-alanine--D-glutamate ligase [Rickettsiales bacterium]|nr:MAG: UDP-N-acetylmuramoyl-L-alanine--D-glutamate ligase [Rickettsiales bacterium]
MYSLNKLKDYSVGIWGLGVEGKAVLEKLNATFPEKEITILDDTNAKDYVDKLDLIIKSPGVSIYKDEIKNAKKTIFITEKTIFYSEMKDAKTMTIGITGTKGKTTTSTFCNYILEKIGYKTLLTGNMGVPTIKLIDEAKTCDFIVTELSSYQTSDLQEFPKAGILLNLYPEHIDWHLTHENYYKDKLHLLDGVEIMVSPYQKGDYNNQIDYNSTNFDVIYKDGFWWKGEQKLWDTTNMKLLGEHNYKNLSFVFTLLNKLNVDLSKIKQEYIDDFNPVEHRLEIVKKDGIVYVNDSICTIPEAAIACYKTFKDKNIYGILGGFDRQQDYTELVQTIKEATNIKYLALLGETGDRLVKNCDEIGYKNYTKCETFEECVKILKEKSSGDNNVAIILSPAAPSYGMFKNFEERGKVFKELITN